MRILICNWKDLAHPAAGGAEVYSHQCAKRWVRWGHQVTQVSAAVPGRPPFELHDGVRLIRQGGRLGVYQAVRRYLGASAGRFDVVVDAVNTRPFFAHHHVGDTPVVALIHQTAQEVWAHETPAPVALVGRYLLEPRWLPAYADVPVMTVSPSSLQSLARFGLSRVHLVPEGVEVPEFDRPPKAAVPTVVFCGRMVSMKRPGDAVEAFRLARARLGSEARLQLVGTGPLLRQLQAEASDGVEVLGWLSEADKFAVLAGAHALVATSVREGWGLVVSEAAAVGTPAIAYDVPGLRDSVRAGGGVLVPERPAALADALVRWVPQFRAEPPAPLPHGGAEDWDTVAEAVLAVLEQHARPHSVRRAA